MTERDIQPRTVRACELYGDLWLNSEPVPVLALRGGVVLLCFWDFACCRSHLLLPYVAAWHGKYAPHGLTVVGVHTPRFTFSQEARHVQAAVRRLQIAYPVVLDNGHLIRVHYDVRSWPTLVLVDRDGFVRAAYEGEGGYLAVERALQALLLDASPSGVMPDLAEPLRDADRPGVTSYRATPELRAGYAGGSLGNVEGVIPESVSHYDDPGLYLDGRIYVEGDWKSGRESLVLEHAGGVMVPYAACEVHGVLSADVRGGLELEVRQDDTFLTRETLGADVHIDRRGRSVLRVEEPRLYALVRNAGFGHHVLRLSCGTGGLTIYAFGFVTGALPELVSSN